MKTEIEQKKGSLVGKLLIIILILLILGAGLFVLDHFYPLFNPAFQYANQYTTLVKDVDVKQVNALLLKNLIAGISIGTVIFIGLLVIIPVFMKDIDTRSYLILIQQGIISSFIFYISQNIFSYFEKINKFYLLLSIIICSIITLILIRFLAKILIRKEKEKVEFKTNITSSITAGLIFSVLLQLIPLGSEYLKNLIAFKP